MPELQIESRISGRSLEEPAGEKLIRVYLSLPPVLEILTLAERREGRPRIYDFLINCLSQSDFPAVLEGINPAQLRVEFQKDLSEAYGDRPDCPQNIFDLQARLPADPSQLENPTNSANTLEYLSSHILAPLISIQETIAHLNPVQRGHLLRLAKHKQAKLARLLLSLRDLTDSETALAA